MSRYLACLDKALCTQEERSIGVLVTSLQAGLLDQREEHGIPQSSGHYLPQASQTNVNFTTAGETARAIENSVHHPACSRPAWSNKVAASTGLASEPYESVRGHLEMAPCTLIRLEYKDQV